MKILVLGATGRTGRHVVTQALAAGHDVAMLARDRSKVPGELEGVSVIDGDATDNVVLSDALRGRDAVISALGRGESVKSEGLIARTVPPLLTTMETLGVKRLVFTSALGVGPSFQDSPVVPKIFFKTLLRGIYADKLIGDQLIRGSSLDWTIVQPAVLTDGPLTKKYRAGEHLPLSGVPKISRADTAHFIVNRLNDPATIGRTFVLAD